MNSEQLSLFPKEKQLIKDIDYVDLSKLPDDHYRKHFTQYSQIIPNTFYLYKTGGINRYMENVGPIFPYVKNIVTGNIQSFSNSASDAYIRCGVRTICGKRILVRVHRVVGIAFIENPLNLPVVNHIDGNLFNYALENLEWSSYSNNNKIKRSDKKYKERHLELAQRGNVYKKPVME